MRVAALSHLFPVCGLSLSLAVGAITAVLPAPTRAADFNPPSAFLQKYCLACHTGSDAENGYDIGVLDRDLNQPATIAKWVRLFDRVEQNEMPPKDSEQPTSADRTAFLNDLGKSLTTASQLQTSAVLRRLNRVEYEHTLNDMLGVRESLAELLPEDGKSHGFDNVGESLDLSAVHLERYMAAAGRAIDAAVRKEPKPEVKRSTHGLADGKGSGNIGKHWHQTSDGAVVVFNIGGFPRPEIESFRAPVEGQYRVRISGQAYQAVRPVPVAVWAGVFNPGGTTEKVATLSFSPDRNENATSREFTVWLKPNSRLSLFPQLNVDNAKLRRDGPAKYDGPGLAIRSVQIEGPLFDEWPGRGHQLLFGDLAIREITPANPQQKKQKWYQPQFEIVSEDPQADSQRLLRKFLPIAFRRPVVDADLAPLLELANSELESGASFEQAIRTAYIAALCSPDFLYLREPVRKADDFALASQLSYAFWNTLPDEELLELARAGELSRPDVLRAQVERLLRDSRSSRFVTTFTGQWLNLREIDFTIPDKQLYPEYDEALKEAMIAETEGFFTEVLRNNLSILNFIDSDWTMLNERLASHYFRNGEFDRTGAAENGRGKGIGSREDGEGIATNSSSPALPISQSSALPTSPSEVVRVKLPPNSHRGGVLTHASVLKVSANGTTTSPVIRGIFVMERMLGMEPPAPPPGVPGVEPDIRGATTLREQLAKHREIESCNNCHRVIDPPGFALESYDVMGGWRENYRSLNRNFPMPSTEQRGNIRNVQWRLGPEVDAAGETPDGYTFNGPDDYKQILLRQPERFAYTLVEKLAVYMTGRPMAFADRPELKRITRSVADKGFGFRDLILEIAQSDLF